MSEQRHVQEWSPLKRGAPPPRDDAFYALAIAEARDAGRLVATETYRDTALEVLHKIQSGPVLIELGVDDPVSSGRILDLAQCLVCSDGGIVKLMPDYSLLVVPSEDVQKSTFDKNMERIVDGLEKLVDHRTEVYGFTHALTVYVRADLAMWIGQAGETWRGVAELRKLIQDVDRWADVPRFVVPELRAELAPLYLALSDVASAQRQVNLALAELRGGPHESSYQLSFKLRTQLANLEGECGDIGRAVRELEGLRREADEHFGPLNRETFALRSDLAGWRGRSGDRMRAVQDLEDLLAAEVQVLGPADADTLVTFNNHAYWLGQCGRVQEAAALLKGLVESVESVLGPGHPWTPWTRSNAAAQVKREGDLGCALDMFQRLKLDQNRLLGELHPDTLLTRAHIAAIFVELGRHGAATRMYGTLLRDQLRVLGAGHPELTETRRVLEWLRPEEGARRWVFKHRRVQ